MPHHWRKGLIRLYIAAAIPWLLWFGYRAYEAHDIYARNRDYVNAVDAVPGTDRRNYMPAAVMRDEYLRKRNVALQWLPVLPIGLPVVLVALAWVCAGFRRHR